jgi:hypothetical protein
MLRRRSWTRRSGMAPLDCVLVIGACLPIAAGLYWLFEQSFEMHLLVIGTAVGWPL